VIIDSWEDHNPVDIEDSRSNSQRHIGDEASFVNVVSADLMPTGPPLPLALTQLALTFIILLVEMGTARRVSFEEEIVHRPAETALLIFVYRFKNQTYGPKLEQCCANEKQYTSSISSFPRELGAWPCGREPVKESCHDKDKTANGEEESNPERDVPVWKLGEHALDACEEFAEFVPS